MTTEPLRCDADELRSLFLFEHLGDEHLDWLCEHGHVELIEPGFAYREGEPATCFYVLIDGEVSLSYRSGVDDVEVTRTSDPGVYAGAWYAYLGDRVSQTYNNSLRVMVPSRLYVLPAEEFSQFMRDWFPMALHLLEGDRKSVV